MIPNCQRHCICTFKTAKICYYTNTVCFATKSAMKVECTDYLLTTQSFYRHTKRSTFCSIVPELKSIFLGGAEVFYTLSLIGAGLIQWRTFVCWRPTAIYCVGRQWIGANLHQPLAPLAGTIDVIEIPCNSVIFS